MATKTVLEGVRDALYNEMVRDERVFIMGEDVGARGNVFLITQGFLDKFGRQRVIDTPLAEASIVGVAIGSAAAALAPAALFKLAFVLIAGIIAAKLLFAGDRWALGSELPGRAGMAGYGFLVGLASSLMGISGGSLVTIILTLYGKPIHSAVATAAARKKPRQRSLPTKSQRRRKRAPRSPRMSRKSRRTRTCRVCRTGMFLPGMS